MIQRLGEKERRRLHASLGKNVLSLGFFMWNNSPQLFMMPRGQWDISSGFGTHIWWPYDRWMQDGRREKRWREALFHETTFYSSLRKNSDKMKHCVLFKAHVPNREKSLLTWRGASSIPWYAINSVASQGVGIWMRSYPRESSSFLTSYLLVLNTLAILGQGLSKA